MTLAHNKTEEHRTTKKSKESSLERVRAAAQELHAAISDAAAKRGDIPTVRIGKLLRVPIRALEQQLNATMKIETA